MKNQKDIVIKIKNTEANKVYIMDEICFAANGGTAFVRTAKDLPEGHKQGAIIPAGTKCEIVDWCEDKFGQGWEEDKLWPIEKYKERVIAGDIPNDSAALYVKFYSGLEGRVIHISDLDFESIEIVFAEE